MTKTRDLADLGGGFIQAGTDAVQRTVESKLQDVISVKDFGAKGDNSTDDYAAFQACANAATLLSKQRNAVIGVFIPAGLYRISQQVVFDVKAANDTVNDPTYATLNSDLSRGITVFGESNHASTLIATPSNTTGLIKFTSTGNRELWTVRSISFLSDLPYTAATTNGTALYIESTVIEGSAGFGEQADKTVIIDDVFIGPYTTSYSDWAPTGSLRGNFNRGIDIRYKWYPEVRNTYILGSANQLSASATGRDAAIYFKGCYHPEVISTQIRHQWDYGIGLDQNTSEDFRLDDVYLVGQVNGFIIYHTGQAGNTLYEPGGIINGCHVDCEQYGIKIESHRQVIISNCLFYVPQGDGLNQGTTGTPSAIWLDGVGDITVNNCQFLEPGFYTNNTNSSVGVKCSNRCEGVVIANNYFNHGGIGLKTDTGATGTVMLTGSRIPGQKTGAWATFTMLVDDANIAYRLETTKPTSDTETVLELDYRISGNTVRNRVTLGAADSGGTGFRVLRVPNS
jgi:hypothetical protein